MNNDGRRRRRGLAPSLLGTILGLAAAAADPSPRAASPEAPLLRLAGQAAPVRYAAELWIDPSATKFAAAIVIDLELKEPTSLLWLNASGLAIEQAALTVAGRQIAAQVVPGNGDFVGFAFARQAPSGAAQLRVRYTGEISTIETDGLFRQKEGDNWYVYSEFEPFYARRAFPCFDEPSYKVPWALTLHVKREHAAVSNTPILAESDEPNGMKRVSFAPTRPLPSYLIALGVGPFDYLNAGTAGRNATPIRFVTAKGRAKEAWYAAETSGAVLDLLEKYLGTPYPYQKLDNLVIPQTVGFGAMENPGLITYASSIVLAKPEAATIRWKRRYVADFAHEAAHMWLGDLVTPVWWDDVWLNESFASWLGDKVTGQFRPEWGGDVDHVLARARAADNDTLISARQIRQPITSKHDIENAFDGITYGKGQAVLQMFESWLGEEKFRAALQHYIARHAFANATADDFVGALAAVGGATVGPAFFSFLTQPGVPEITVELRCEDGSPRLLLSQKRFLPLGSKGSDKQLWQVPVCVRWGNQTAPSRVCTLLAAESAELPLPVGTGGSGSSCPEWVLGNAGGLGYYRVHYRGNLLARLLGGGAQALTLPERVGALHDAAALADSGDLSMREALALVPVYAHDPSRHVVEATVALAVRIRDHLVPERLLPSYARFVEQTFGEQARALGFTPHPGEREETMLLRDALVGFVAENGDDAALLAEAGILARKWVAERTSVSPETAAAVLRLAALHGGQALFDLYHAEAKKTANRRERSMLLAALGSFQDPAIARQALAVVLTDEFDPREAMTILNLWSSRAPMQQMRYEFVKRHFDTLAAKLPRDYPASFPNFARRFCDEEHRADAEAFFKDSIAKFTGGPRTLAKALEEISLCSAFKSAQQQGVEQFLALF
ncbi:MAG TPA: M1 family metallopeptidase [Thermoanaerobaculia bacterium]|nr:M1 family metallopeptidase [Thermoanaerobaculia bacterium]